MQKEEPDKAPEMPVYWIETSNSVSRRFQFEPNGQLSVSFIFLFLLSHLSNFTNTWLACFQTNQSSNLNYGVIHFW